MSTARPRPARSAGSPKRSAIRGRSACQRSTASITADTFAAGAPSPLPLATDSPRAFGRTAAKTSIPVRSKPVRRATRVIPNSGSRGSSRASVRAGVSRRWVPSVKRLRIGGAEVASSPASPAPPARRGAGL